MHADDAALTLDPLDALVEDAWAVWPVGH